MRCISLFGLILPVSLSVALALSLAIVFAPARADHFLIHPAAAPNLAKSTSQASTGATALFQRGAEIKLKSDPNVYITSRNIPENAPLLEAYNADRPNRGRAQTRAGEAAAPPGLLGIAAQVYRAQDASGRNARAYTLADAMRDAIWRRKTAARLRSLTDAPGTCADRDDDTAKSAPSIGLGVTC